MLTLGGQAGDHNPCGRCGRFGLFGRSAPVGLRTTIRLDPVKTRLPLAYQILAFQVGILLLSALLGGAAAVWQAGQQLDHQYEQRSLAIAESVASNTAVQQALLAGDTDGLIQRTAESVRHSTGATYVVVANRQGIRFSHPNPAMIGKPLDEEPAVVLAGHTWVGVQRGTLGISARGKAPIFFNGQVIGLVSVGFLEATVWQQLLNELPGFALTVLLALALGGAGSMWLASRLKRQTFGLEPYEIAGLLEEREASLQGIHEGAIATDRTGTITLANDEARRLLALPADCVGTKVSQVVPQGRLLKFLSGGLNDEDEVLLAGDRVLLASRRSIRVRVSDDTVMTRSSLDSEDLITLLGNLVDNALDAAASSTGERWVSVSVTEHDAEIVIKIHDSGPGIAEGLDGQIFQEGFSTKSAPGHKRRGFGLALVRQVARRHGGDVTVVNDGGAYFTARLPLRIPAKA